MSVQIFADNFVGADTAPGAAGSSTALSPWVDVSGAIWSRSTNRAKAATGAITALTWLTRSIAGSDTRDVQIVYDVQTGTMGSGPTNVALLGAVRYQSGTGYCYFADAEYKTPGLSNFGILVYNGSGVSGYTALAATTFTYDPAIAYEISFTATSGSPTLLTATLFNSATMAVIATVSTTDNEPTLQNTGLVALGVSPGLSGGANYYFTGTKTYNLDPPVLSGAIDCSTAFALSWTQPATPSTFNVYRGTTPGGPYPTLVYSNTGASTTDIPPVLTGTTYYVVAMAAGGGTSAYSNEVALTLDCVAPNVLTSTVAKFTSGAVKAIGRYLITYRAGAYKFNPNRPLGWTVNSHADIPTLPRTGGFKITDTAGNEIYSPGNTTEYSTQAACEAANAGANLTYDHVGGLPIGVYLLDFPYSDNVPGSPNPTFQICGPVNATLTASALQIMPGGSSTLTWASVGATSATDPVGGTTLSGSSAVSPGSTTTYTMAVVGAGTTKSVSLTIVVTRPSTTTGLTAAGQCGGTILLSWDAGTYVTGYLVERSPDGMVWTQIGTPTPATYTDTPPVPGTTYYYRVRSTDGTNNSAYSGVASAASLLVPPTPAGLAAVAHGGRLVLTWTAPVGPYGVVTTSVYLGMTSGGETLLASGVAGTTYTASGLQDGVTYFVYIKFVNTCGTSGSSAEASGVPSCCANAFTQASAPASTLTMATAPASTCVAASAPSSASLAPLVAPGSTLVQVADPSGTLTAGGCPG